MGRFERVIVTCEHGGNRIPQAYAALFLGNASILKSHEGFDAGALALTVTLARHLEARLHAATISRLFVELNRSPHHPMLFSEITSALSRDEKTRILAQYYYPYREAVEKAITDISARGKGVLHLSVHTFAPILHGIKRQTDIGLLYDPSRDRERDFCAKWQTAFRTLYPSVRVRRNYPYRGTADGFTTYLRKRFPEDQYTAIELEINQQLAAGPPNRKRILHRMVVETLDAAMKR